MIDIKAISLCITLINIFLCVMLFAAWRFQKVYAGFGFWVLANVALALGYTVMVLTRGMLPNLITILATNLFFILAAWLRLEGLHRFLGEKRPWYPHFLLIALALLVLWVFSQVTSIRTALISGILAFYLFTMTQRLISNARGEVRVLYRCMAVVFFVYALMLSSRSIIALIAPSQVVIPEATLANITFFLPVMLLDIGVIFSFLMMNDKRLAMELGKSEKRLARVQQSISDGFLVLDDEQRITYFNEAAVRMLGPRRKEVLDEKLWDAFPEAKDSVFNEKFATVIREKKFLSFETCFGQEPSQSWYAARIYPFADGISVFLQDITELKQVQGEREKLIVQLQKALAEVKTLKGILPICASCKKIRNDEGYWDQIEAYIGKRSEAEFSHGICPECARKLYPDFDIYDKDGKLVR